MQAQANERQYDVVIIGAGPAGLVAAAWMSAARVNTLLVDASPAPPPCGRADGIESRTFEILDSFGLGDSIWREANQTVEVSIWVSNPEKE
ncbi:unnamed protein product [Clonostachys rosea]|uniref:FAD-binding domain-containing protein n=1 Tax=Bionectria ochroleuca TaxID=29856 RepID=A0ABY6V2M9_BIOOC|nr:unnamed protein product [Clonostachys rosea]